MKLSDQILYPAPPGLDAIRDQSPHLPEVVQPTRRVCHCPGSQGEADKAVRADQIGHPGRAQQPHEAAVQAPPRGWHEHVDAGDGRHPESEPPQGGEPGDDAARPRVQLGRHVPLIQRRRPALSEVDTTQDGLPRSLLPDPVPQGHVGHAALVRLAAGDDAALLTEQLAEQRAIELCRGCHVCRVTARADTFRPPACPAPPAPRHDPVSPKIDGNLRVSGDTESSIDLVK